MHELDVLVTLTGGLGAALIFGYIAKRLKSSTIVGYLLAGIIIGPFTPGFFVDRAIAEQFAEIGVILLLFGIGLHFHLRELLAVWRIAIPGALIQSSISTLLLALLLHILGWSWQAGIVLGMAISVASTVIMSLVLAEKHDLYGPIGNIAIGWTVVEDLITVIFLLLLPIIFSRTGASDLSLIEVFGLAALKILGLVATVLVLGRWVIPWALDQIEKTHSRELFTLSVLVIAIGIAVGSSKLFGMSIALGAFLAGLAVGRSEFSARAANDALPMRDAFAVLFFVSVGMLFNPHSLLESPLVTLAVLVVILVGKPLVTILTVRILGKPLTLAIPIGAAFSQIGEFSFILGVVAFELGVIDSIGWNALVAASIIAMALNPLIYRWGRRLSVRVSGTTSLEAEKASAINPRHCIIVGYGPVGRTVHGILEARGEKIAVIELNLKTVRELRANGVTAYYGDALRTGTLEEAGISTTGSLVISSDVFNSVEIVRQARSLNPGLRILVRCSHLRAVEPLRKAGATVIISGEAEVAVALAEAVTKGEGSDYDTKAEQRESLRSRLYNSRKN